jgi:hypothetical protein
MRLTPDGEVVRPHVVSSQPFKAQWLLRSTCFFNHSAFCIEAYVFCMNLSVNSDYHFIKQLFLELEKCCVLFELQNEFLNIFIAAASKG